jgi:hypothetical protein
MNRCCVRSLNLLVDRVGFVRTIRWKTKTILRDLRHAFTHFSHTRVLLHVSSYSKYGSYGSYGSYGTFAEVTEVVRNIYGTVTAYFLRVINVSALFGGIETHAKPWVSARLSSTDLGGLGLKPAVTPRKALCYLQGTVWLMVSHRPFLSRNSLIQNMLVMGFEAMCLQLAR